MLLNHYLAQSARNWRPAKTLNSEAMDVLQGYDWPGNVRQLVNATRRLTVTAPGGVITEVDIPVDLGGDPRRAAQCGNGPRGLRSGPSSTCAAQAGRAH